MLVLGKLIANNNSPFGELFVSHLLHSYNYFLNLFSPAWHIYLEVIRK